MSDGTAYMLKRTIFLVYARGHWQEMVDELRRLRAESKNLEEE